MAAELIAKRFELRELLGRGSEGEVWSAWDRNESTEVAVKLLARRTFSASEAAVRLGVEHPSLPRTVEIGRHRGRGFVAMERVGGVALDALRSAGEVIEAGLQVADALAALHDAGLVHGDVKPANVLVREGRAWLIDPDLGGEAGDRVTRGTAAYMAPEQLAGERDARTDLLALGVTLLESIAGRHPWSEPGEALSVALLRAARGAVPRGDVLERVPAALREGLLSLVAPDPGDRPPSARAWAALWSSAAAGAGLVRPEVRVEALSAVPDRPRWAGDPSARARAADAIVEALRGRGFGVAITGAEGSGRRRLLEDALRDARLRCIEDGAVPPLVDALDAAGEVAIVRGFDLPRDDVRDLAAGALRLRRYDARRVAVAVTASVGPEVEGLTEVRVEALSVERFAGLVEALAGTPTFRPAAQAWREVTGGLAGRLVRAARRLGPGALTAPPTEGATADTTLDARALEAFTPSERSVMVMLEAAGPLPFDVLARAERGAADAMPALRRGGVIDGPAWEPRLTATLDPNAVPPALRRRCLEALREALSGGAFERAAPARARVAAALGDVAEAWARWRQAVALRSTGAEERARWMREAAPVAPDPAGFALERARLLVRMGRGEEALELLGDAGGGAEADALRFEALRRAGRSAEAHELAERLAVSDDPTSRAVGELGLAREMVDRSALDEADATLGSAWPEGEGLPPELGLRGVELGARLALARGDVELALRRVERGEALADAIGRGDVRARLRDLAGMALQQRGDLEGARGAYREAVEAAEREGDATAATAYRLNLGGVALELGRLGEALGMMRAAAARLARENRLSALARTLANLGSLLEFIGDPSAAEVAGRAREASREAGDAIAEAFAAMVRAESTRPDGEAAVELEAAAEAMRALDADALACECEARAARRWIAARELAKAEGATSRAERGGAVMALLARAELSLARADGPALREGLSAVAAAVSREPGVEQELWHLGLRARSAGTLGGDVASERRRWWARVEALAQSLDETSAARFMARHDGEAPVVEAPNARPAAGSAAPDRWRRLAAVTQRLASQQDVDALLEGILDAVVELTGAARGLLLLRDANGALAVRAARRHHRVDGSDDAAAFSRSLAERVARGGEALVAVDAAGDSALGASESVAALRLRSVMAVPLRVGGEVLGVLCVDDRYRAGAFDDEALDVAVAFADAAGLALRNARDRAELRGALDRAEVLSSELEATVATQRATLEAERQSRGQDATRGRYDALVGRGSAMRKTLALVDRLAPTAMPVLLLGESGSGKELVARAVHANSPRARRPFVAENCGAIPETLLESALFGHVRGAFTGADRPRQGLFEAADGGTLFLDEIGEMSPAMQARLLRVLQDGEVRPVGGDTARKVDVRVIAATHRNLDEMVRRGTFREDLYYRVAVMVVPVPALRERREDIPALVAHFLERTSPGTGIERRALSRLADAPWPGNVRQLQNELARAAVLCDGVIREEHLSPELRGGSSPAAAVPERPLDLRVAVDHTERALVERALSEHGGNQSRAARALGLSRFGLQKKLKRLGIDARRAAGRAGR